MSSNKSNKPRLIPQVSAALRRKHYSYVTEKTYIHLIIRFVKFHKLQHPEKLNAKDVERFLTYLAKDLRVSANTQNQALNAIVFLYREVLRIEVGNFGSFLRAKRPKPLPDPLSHEEVSNVLKELKGVPWLMACIIYGCGLRLNECLRLRVSVAKLS